MLHDVRVECLNITAIDIDIGKSEGIDDLSWSQSTILTNASKSSETSPPPAKQWSTHCSQCWLHRHTRYPLTSRRKSFTTRHKGWSQTYITFTISTSLPPSCVFRPPRCRATKRSTSRLSLNSMTQPQLRLSVRMAVTFQTALAWGQIWNHHYHIFAQRRHCSGFVDTLFFYTYTSIHNGTGNHIKSPPRTWCMTFMQ